MKNFYAFILGGLFSVGLIVSGMSDPTKVLNFLDIFGSWDPSLAFVMLGAITIAILPFQYAVRQQNPETCYGENIELPSHHIIDKNLIIGASLFGIGWGIAGMCPAPSFTLIGLGYYDTFYFIAAMLVGVSLHRLWGKKNG